MIKTVIFDIGNVLMRFDYPPYVEALLKDDDTVDKVNGAIWRSGLWNELDRGEDPEKIFSLMMEKEPQYRDEIRRTLDNVGQCMHRTDYAIPWIKEIKNRGYQVLYLSNYSEFIMEKEPSVLDFLPFMDGGVFSCRAHLLKPDPAIYQKICSDHQLTPSECVFIDDKEENIIAAEKFGLNAIRFTGYEETKEELDAFLAQRS